MRSRTNIAMFFCLTAAGTVLGGEPAKPDDDMPGALPDRVASAVADVQDSQSPDRVAFRDERRTNSPLTPALSRRERETRGATRP